MSDVEYRVLTLDSGGWEDWDEFLDSASGATVYHREAWLRSVGEGMAQDLRVHAVLEGGRICAGAVVRRGGRRGLRSGHKPWASAYNGVVARAGISPRLLEGLCAALRNAYASVRLVQGPGAVFGDAAERGWRLRSWPTLVLDVRDTERLWNACDRRMRQRVRKARGLGIHVARSSDAESFERLYRMTYERQGQTLNLAAGSVERTVAAALARGAAVLHTALTAEGEAAAALVVGEAADRAYFMLAASHPSLRHTDAVTLLWWSVLEECSARVQFVDLVGTGTAEIGRFKRSFSPETVECVDAVSQALRWRLALKLTGGARV
jgi:hypothetical protein